MLEFPPDIKEPAYRAIFKAPMARLDNARSLAQFLSNEIVLEAGDSSKFPDRASASEELAARVAAIDVQTCGEVENLTKIIFEGALDHGDRNGMGSKVAEACAGSLHTLDQRFPEFRERDAETGTEVGSGEDAGFGNSMLGNYRQLLVKNCGVCDCSINT